MFVLDHVTLNGSQRPRLDDVTMSIGPGRTAIVGYSGAGKTSLLNVLAGFEPADSGTVRRAANGEHADPSEKKTRPSRPNSGRLPLFWVPQNGGLWPQLTVDQHLECVSQCQKRPSESVKRADSGRTLDSADEILRALDLELRRSAFPSELSLGERSRLALARALASKAEVLLMDEPLSHVDPVRKPDYWKVVQQVISEGSISVVFSSHEPETVLRQADHVICLHDGGVVFQGTTRSLYNSPPSRRVGEFLGPLNWFDLDEAALFLAERDRLESCVAIRPERMRLVASEASDVEFVSMPFRGAYAESWVRHVGSGRTRVVMHQNDGTVPDSGARVVLKAIHEPS